MPAMFSVSIKEVTEKITKLTKTPRKVIFPDSHRSIEISTKVEVTFDKDMNIISMV